MDESTVVLRLPRVLAHLMARSTPAFDASAVAARDLARYYALLQREQAGAVVSPNETCLIRDALPSYRAARREDPGTSLAAAVAVEGSDGGQVYEVDVPALTERLRGLGPLQLLAVIDLAERIAAAVLRGDFEGRQRVREEFGIGGRGACGPLPVIRP